MESIKFANKKHVLQENKPLYKMNDEKNDQTYI